MSQLGEDPGQARVAASIYLTLPGVPFIYYGEEIGMTGRKPDEQLRTPMQWSGEEGAGFTTGQPWHPINGDYRTKNVAAQMVDEDSLLNHYRRLIRIRSTYGALRSGDLLPVSSDSLSVYAYIRHGEDEDILMIHSLSAEAQTDYALTLRASALAPGAYRVRDLLEEAKGVRLEVDDKGGFSDYVPFPTLEPHQTRILLLDR
jgi:glycosidase